MTSPKNKSNQRLNTLTFPSLASLTLVACSSGGGGELIVKPPPTNTMPMAAADKTVDMDEDSTNTALNISAPSDAEGERLTITVTAVPTGGTLTMADGNELVSYTHLRAQQTLRHPVCRLLLE